MWPRSPHVVKDLRFGTSRLFECVGEDRHRVFVPFVSNLLRKRDHDPSLPGQPQRVHHEVPPYAELSLPYVQAISRQEASRVASDLMSVDKRSVQTIQVANPGAATIPPHLTMVPADGFAR